MVLLPPSETKADGGSGVLDPAALGFPALRGRRRTAIAAVRRIPLAEAGRVLQLGPRSMHEAAWNRSITTSAVLPAVERFTGVLYDGIALPALDSRARRWIDEHVVIASALFGLLRASDRIPLHRLSASTALPGLPLRAHWAAGLEAALEGAGEWILDGRSSAYVALGSAPAGSARLHVETLDDTGRRRALNHFNKHAKGGLVRALAVGGAQVGSRDELLAWAEGAGLALEPRGEHDVTLLV